MNDNAKRWLDFADENLACAYDSIYLSSKYPLGSALPDYAPDRSTCDKCIAIAQNVIKCITRLCG